MLAGLQWVVNPYLATGVAILHAPESVHAWLEVDCTDTLQRIVVELNRRESEFRAWLDKDFLQACGIQSCALTLLPVAHPMRCPVHRSAILIDDPIVSERRVHPSPSLMLKRGVSGAQAAITETAAMVLALDHNSDSTFVFAPACRRFLADFPSVRIDADRTVENDAVAQRGFGIEPGARDGTAADHGLVVSVLFVHLIGSSPAFTSAVPLHCGLSED
jgi:hypothetical protein